MEDLLNEFAQNYSKVLNLVDFAVVGEDVEFLLDLCVKPSTFFDETSKSAQVLLDLCWQKMNTGYWKNVHMSWRYIYSLASFRSSTINLQSSKSDNKTLLKDSLKVCDKGLLMGAPIMNNILARLATKLHQKLASSSEQHVELKLSSQKESDLKIEIQHPIVVDNDVSLLDFMVKYLAKEIPVVIGNSTNHWPAMNKWNLDYIKNVAGYRTVPVEIGSKYTDEAWSQSLMTINEFCRRFLLNNEEGVGYLAQHQLFDQIPELREDLCIPEYCLSDSSEEDVDINAWFGPANTVSPLHFDPRHNILTQIFGSKYIRLYSPDISASLYPHDGRMLFNTSRVDFENVDDEQFPMFRNATYTECILHAGEMLFIPKKWWHFVKSLNPSFSVSFWFGIPNDEVAKEDST